MAYNLNRRFPVSHGEFFVCHGEPKIAKGELSHFTIEHASHSGLLLLRDPHHQHLTLEEVYFQSRENFKANKKELQIG
jgi:hypothetical protein